MSLQSSPGGFKSALSDLAFGMVNLSQVAGGGSLGGCSSIQRKKSLHIESQKFCGGGRSPAELSFGADVEIPFGTEKHLVVCGGCGGRSPM